MEAGLLKAGASMADILPNSQNSKNAGEKLVKGILSKELQLYYDKITESVFDDAKAIGAMESLSKDPGLQPLLPYFLQFITDNVSLGCLVCHILTLIRS